MTTTEHDPGGKTKLPSRYEGKAIFGGRSREYRYFLLRKGLQPETPEQGKALEVAFIGLNPSTADALVDDPTVRRCVNYAKRWGYDRCVMLNAYAYRATSPADMWAAMDPIGSANDTTIQAACQYVKAVFAAWGTSVPFEREEMILRAVARSGYTGDVFCLAKTKDGHPAHPLYQRADVVPEVYLSASDLAAMVSA